MQCQNNLKQLAIAVHAYQDAHDRFPAGTVVNTGLKAEARLSWVVDVLPYLEQEPLYQKFDREKGWQDEAHTEWVAGPLRVVVCSSAVDLPTQGPRIITYAGVAGVGPDAAQLSLPHSRAGFFGYDRSVKDGEEVADGLSNTLLLVSITRDLGPWAAGGRPTVRGIVREKGPYTGEGGAFARIHMGGSSWVFSKKSPWAVVAMADGSTRRIAKSVAPEVFEAAATLAGGEVLPLDF